jgi:tellurium resistance protein TerD
MSSDSQATGGVSLRKGGNLSLSKAEPGLSSIIVGLGWSARSTNGSEFDLDASAFLLNGMGKVRGDADFIFYNQLSTPDESVIHTGDNRTGDGDGDDERIKIELDRLSGAIERVAVAVTIHDADARGQNFGMVRDAYIRIVDARNDREIARYDLTEDASVETAMIFGEVYRKDGEWKFRAVGQGFSGGLAALCRNHGVNAA